MQHSTGPLPKQHVLPLQRLSLEPLRYGSHHATSGAPLSAASQECGQHSPPTASAKEEPAMVLAVAPSLSSEVSCLPGEKVRLRLSYGGTFIVVSPQHPAPALFKPRSLRSSNIGVVLGRPR